MELERYAPRLLLWLAEHAEGRGDVPVDCADFRSWQLIQQPVLDALVDHLTGLGFIRPYEGVGGGDGCVVLLEPSGAEQARRLQRRREDDTERARYAQDAVLEWLRVHRGRPPFRLVDFYDSPHVFFLGTALTQNEVEQAVTHLETVGLLERTTDLLRVELTTDGRDFVWSGSRLDEYVRHWRERRDAPSPTVVQVTYSVQLGPAELGLLVERLAPELGLDADALDELLHLSGQLAGRPALPGDPANGGTTNGTTNGTTDGSTGGNTPDPSRPGVLTRIRDLVGSASGGAVKSMLEDVVAQVVRSSLGM